MDNRKQKITKPEICYECWFFRWYSTIDTFTCINPKSPRCDKTGISKAAAACEFSELNPELIKNYPDSYSKQDMLT